MLSTCSHEWLYRQIGEASSEAFIVSDRGGAIRLWNPGAEAMFGFESREAVGQSLDLIIPEKLRPRHWSGYRQVMETGATRYAAKLLSTPAVCKDGTPISIEFSMTLICDGAGEIVGTAAIIRDVTVRWTKEKVLRERLMHLEAKVIKEAVGE